MTPTTKPTVRLTSAYVRDRGLRPLVAVLTGSLLELRPKGLRSHETIDLASIYDMAVRARLALERKTKAKRRAKP